MDEEENLLDPMREKMYGLCFPNVPRTLMEQEAFEQAVRLQYDYEQQNPAPPPGAKGFKIGEFEMTLDGRGGAAGTLCPAAYGLLLRSGLLYRGVEGRRTC